MGELRRPGEQARAEPDEEEEHGLEGREFIGQTVLYQQRDR